MSNDNSNSNSSAHTPLSSSVALPFSNTTSTARNKQYKTLPINNVNNNIRTNKPQHTSYASMSQQQVQSQQPLRSRSRRPSISPTTDFIPHIITTESTSTADCIPQQVTRKRSSSRHRTYLRTRIEYNNSVVGRVTRSGKGLNAAHLSAQPNPINNYVQNAAINSIVSTASNTAYTYISRINNNLRKSMRRVDPSALIEASADFEEQFDQILSDPSNSPAAKNNRRRSLRISHHNNNSNSTTNTAYIPIIAHKLNLTQFQVSIILLLTVLTVLVGGVGLHLLVNCVSVVYPLYASLRTLQGELWLRTSDSSTDRAAYEFAQAVQLGRQRHWLSYWTIYGIFTRFDVIFDTAFSWVPMYWPFKLIFLLWCFLPQYQGALVLYHNVIMPMISSRQQAIDALIDTAQQASELAHRHMNQHVDHVSDRIRLNSKALSDSVHQHINNVSTTANIVKIHRRELSSLIWTKNVAAK